MKLIYNRVVKAMCLTNGLRLMLRLITKVESVYIKYIGNVRGYITNPSFTDRGPKSLGAS